MKLLKPLLMLVALFAGAYGQGPMVADASADTASAGPADFAVYYNEGNKAYREGRFADALDVYREAVSAGARHSALYYNLGNTHYRLGNLGRAILNYERALRLAPSDEDARANLELARQLTADESEADVEQRLVGGLRELLAEVPSWLLASALSAGLFGACLIGAWWALGGRRSGLAVLGVVLASVMLVGATGTLVGRALLSDEGTAAVVLSNQIEARFEPSNTAKVAFVLHEGTRIRLERTEGTWALVSVPNGLRGWVPQSSYERI